jgi:hypothetical protein
MEGVKVFALTAIIIYLIRYKMKLIGYFRDGIKIYNAQQQHYSSVIADYGNKSQYPSYSYYVARIPWFRLESRQRV